MKEVGWYRRGQRLKDVKSRREREWREGAQWSEVKEKGANKAREDEERKGGERRGMR